MKRIDKALLKNLLETRMQADLDAARVSGAGLIVRQDGEICYKGVFGIRNPAGDPVTEAQTYRLASMTKPVTAVAAMCLYDDGKLGLDDPISRWLPAYAEQNIAEPDGNGGLRIVRRAQTPITVRHLLTHTSGLGSGDLCAVLQPAETVQARATLRGMTDFYADAGLAFEPFTAQMYSGMVAFSVMARIVEIISGQHYNDFLRERIFEPCGMPDTTFLPSEDQWARMIGMADRQDERGCFSPTVPGCAFEDYPCCGCQGGAGLISTLHDYSVFAEMLLHGGMTGSTRVLSCAAHAQLCRAHVPASIMPGNESWGLGVRVITGDGYGALPVGTYGWSGAYGTHFWVDPVNRITAVYLKNSRYDGGAGCVTGVNFEKDVAASLV